MVFLLHVIQSKDCEVYIFNKRYIYLTSLILHGAAHTHGISFIYDH